MSEPRYIDVRNKPVNAHPLVNADDFHRLEPHHFEIQGLRLFLWRLPHQSGMPVLLLHGASAGAQTFTTPSRLNGSPRSLMDCLHHEGFEPWLLDWRGSMNVAADLGSAGLRDHLDHLDFDQAAEYDIPVALDIMRKERRDAIRLGVVGFCMGGGTLAQAIAAGHIAGDPPLTHAVLMTLGLFYKTSTQNLLKVQDHLLERLLNLDRGGSRGTVFAIDPRVDDDETYEQQPEWRWPEPLEDLYLNWPGRTQPSHTAEQIQNLLDETKLRAANIARMCNRVSFMFGDPYREMNLVPELHESELPNQFGAIPIKMYAHGAKNVRRGWAAPVKASDVVATDDSGVQINEGAPDPRQFLTVECLQRFYALDKVTLITGAMNQLWHRDSIDCMYEWLVRGHVQPVDRIRKVILDQYGHQDLLWGRQAARDVFPKILAGLR